jgi:hypothetical protein
MNESGEQDRRRGVGRRSIRRVHTSENEHDRRKDVAAAAEANSGRVRKSRVNRRTRNRDTQSGGESDGETGEGHTPTCWHRLHGRGERVLPWECWEGEKRHIGRT